MPEMLIRQWRSWPDNAIIPDLAHPVNMYAEWVASPNMRQAHLEARGWPIVDYNAPPPQPGPVARESKATSQEQARSGQNKRDDDPSIRWASRLSLRFLWHLLGRRGRGEARGDLPLATLSAPAPEPQRVRAKAEDWKAYGHWARPVIDGVMVRNATPPPVPRKLTIEQVEAVVKCLRDTDGIEQPRNWIPRAEHPAIPPEAALWASPPLDGTSMRPVALQLNPFLEHRRFGMAAVSYDLRWFDRDDNLFVLGEMPPFEGSPPQIVYTSMLGPNGAQPATYPGVTSLKVTMLADDSLMVFPWPFIVNAHHEALPVTVYDVLTATRYNFEQRMSQVELDSLSVARREMVLNSYRIRTRRPNESGEDTVPENEADALRRLDYLGSNYIFRGLEPAPDDEGYILFMGAP